MARRPSIDPFVAAAVEAALAKKAEEVAVLDLHGLSDATDYFLICHGRSARQTQTIADSIEEALRALRRRASHIEGFARGEWILMDYFDFVVHVFTADRRTYYGLEKLWADAPRIPAGAKAPRAKRRQAGAGGEAADEAAPEEI